MSKFYELYPEEIFSSRKSIKLGGWVSEHRAEAKDQARGTELGEGEESELWGISLIQGESIGP